VTKGQNISPTLNQINAAEMILHFVIYINPSAMRDECAPDDL